MSTQNFKAAIEEAAKRIGIDMIGFASKARFEGVDPQHNPFSIFPEGKTVIMLGKRICRGALRGVEEGTNFGDYSLFGKNWLEDEFLSCLLRPRKIFGGQRLGGLPPLPQSLGAWPSGCFCGRRQTRSQRISRL